jgi:hypothetical protein
MAIYGRQFEPGPLHFITKTQSYALRQPASFVGPSSMWAPSMPAKPALECGSSSYRLPPLIHPAIAPELE